MSPVEWLERRFDRWERARAEAHQLRITRWRRYRRARRSGTSVSMSGLWSSEELDRYGKLRELVLAIEGDTTRRPLFELVRDQPGQGSASWPIPRILDGLD